MSAFRYDPKIRMILNSDGNAVAQVHAPSHERDPSLGHTMAAGPDLLVALENAGQRFKRIREKFADWNNMNGAQRADFRNWIWHAECEAEAAIKKATAP